MTDYSKMSDFEINKAVAITLGAKQVDFYENGDRCAIYYELEGRPITVRRGQGLVNEQFNPCRDPADAWPIIIRCLISIDSIFDKGNAWLAFGGDDSEYRHVHSNPLRAAMIVFLMMKALE